VITVETDTERVEQRLRAGGVMCPDCGGVVVAWWFARLRVLRGADGCRVRVRPRRGRCRGCRRTHVLLPRLGLLRRADTVDVIGAGLQAAGEGRGSRWIAGRLGRPRSTVRGWLRRLAGSAESVRAGATGLLGVLVGDPPALEPAGSAVADAVRAVLVMTAAVVARFAVALTVSVWEVVAAVTGGRLLAPGGACWSINTSRP
jgi:hypothetical protein